MYLTSGTTYENYCHEFFEQDFALHQVKMTEKQERELEGDDGGDGGEEEK